ncbi:MAG TPA: formylglycine-generating enzyme family protein [Chryseolinea sp.]|nr:formylglycine-generating enzyme family protein [Chryseolinea sp.]
MKGIASIICSLIVTSLFSQAVPQMVFVEGGSFAMGSEQGERDEKPLHKVSVEPFWMAKTETTVGQWRVFCTSTGRAMPHAPWFGWNDDHPIVNISWDDAVAYCYWLRDQHSKLFRLPTEAEWEFAANGGTKGKGFIYSGDNIPDSVAWYGHKTDGTMPVAEKPPNELGLFDMSGNVWEWCSDWYDENYYQNGIKVNPPGPTNGRFRTLRGGAWDIGARNTRNTYRNPLSPTSRNHNKGFRVVYSK